MHSIIDIMTSKKFFSKMGPSKS